MDRAYTLIVNPVAGRGRALRRLPRLVDALAEAALDCEVRVSTRAGEPPELARRAIEEGRVPVACGGDGLVGQLAGAVADAGGTLAIVPSGTGNDFARALGYDPSRPLAAVDVLARGETTRVDLGRVGDRWFGCVAGSGFDAEANRWANEVTWLKGTSLYVAATVRTLAAYTPHRFELTVDGETHERHAWLVAVANGGSYGGGMLVAPEARIDDGLLHATVVGPVSRLEFLRTFPKVFRGTHVEHPRVETFVGRSFELAAPEGDLPVYADGEPAGALPTRVSVVERALEVVVPPTSPLL